MTLTPVALFVRVSTKSQSYDRQIADLTAVAQRQAYQVIQVISETGSATKRRNIDRPEIEQLLELCRSGSIKKVLVSEFSRLGRRDLNIEKHDELVFLLPTSEHSKVDADRP